MSEREMSEIIRGQNAHLAGTLVDVLRAAQCALVVVCPGSRSTPLVLALDASDLSVRVAHDERSAAFMALGAARASGRPAAVVTTSGTAVGNLFPAVLEAEAEGLPLIALTADRPRDWVGSGANQTLEQHGVFGAHVAAAFDLDEMTYRVRARLDACLGALAGPLHLNARFKKPLEIGAPSVEPARVRALGGDAPHPVLPRDVIATWAAAKSPLLVVGRLLDPRDQAAAAALVAHLQWATHTSALSGLRLRHLNAPLLDDVDGALGSEAFAAAFAPDLVVHLGGPVVSARLSAHLAAYPMVRVGGRDPEDGAAQTVAGPVRAFADAMRAAFSPRGPSKTTPNALSSLFRRVSAARVDAPLPREAEVARAAVAGDVAHVFVGNSSPIRDVDRFAQRTDTPVRLYANRGLSGIDGGLSTAGGIAYVAGRVRALVGDVAFLHDAGALSALGDVDLDIVVVDNRGGGLFDRLPIARAATPALFERYFITPHDVDIAALAAAYGVSVRVARTERKVEARQRADYDLALRRAVDAAVRGGAS